MGKLYTGSYTQLMHSTLLVQKPQRTSIFLALIFATRWRHPLQREKQCKEGVLASFDSNNRNCVTFYVLEHSQHYPQRPTTTTSNNNRPCKEGPELGYYTIMNLEVERPSRKEATIKWNRVSIANKYAVTVKDLGRPSFLQTVSTHSTQLYRFKIPDPLIPGHKYQVTVKATLGDPPFETTLREDSIEFRAVFTQNEIEQLYQKAISFVKYGGQDSITWFYRNKPQTYFDDIFQNHAGVMKVYIKDNNGDPASIINGQINGLFFASHLVAGTNRIPDRSIFGEIRLLIPAFSFLANYGARLYFADFYCIHKWHYVTLVLTTAGSPADNFCRENLILLDMSKNAFLIQSSGEVLVTKTAHIEVLYTEDIDILAWEENCGAHRTRVPSTGTSKPGGLPKRGNCKVCNLDPTMTDQDFLSISSSLMEFLNLI